MRTIARAAALLGASVVAVAGLGTLGASAAVPPVTVTDGAATVSGTHIVGTHRSYALLAAGSRISVTGHYASSDTGGSTDEIQIGWAGSAKPKGCIYTGIGPQRGPFTFTLGKVPTAANVNDVVINFAQDPSCDTGAWATSNAGPAVAEVATVPADTGSSGPISVSGVTIKGLDTNAVSRAATKSVSITGSFAIGNTGGAIDQIEVGWEGSSAPVGCAYDGGGPRTGHFSFTLGPPPNAGANYIIVDYGQAFSCDTDGWWNGSNEPPGAAVVALDYNHVPPGQ